MKEQLAHFCETAVWQPGIHRKVINCLSQYPVDMPNEVDLHGETEIDHYQRVLHQVAYEDEELGSLIRAFAKCAMK